MNKPTYTEKLHAHRVKTILMRDNTCDCCPASSGFDSNGSVDILWNDKSDPCKICHNFLGNSPYPFCPCHVFGAKEAIERTWVALKEKGYL